MDVNLSDLELLTGQKIVLSEDVQFKEMLSDKPFILKKGKELFVKADDNKYLTDVAGMMYPFKFKKKKGYYVKGITDYIYTFLELRFPFNDICEEYEIEENEIKDCIQCALEELGFWSDTGNYE